MAGQIGMNAAQVEAFVEWYGEQPGGEVCITGQGDGTIVAAGVGTTITIALDGTTTEEE